MQLGEKIKILRTGCGLTQNSLAQKLYTSRQTVTKWETNISLPDVMRLKRLSEIFDISIDSMLSDVSFN